MDIKSKLSALIPERLLLSNREDLELYGQDWLKHYTPHASLVVLPETVEQVQKVLSFCNGEKLSVVPSGGRTGLSGGAAATKGEIILSLSRMNKIISVDPIARCLTCEAGTPTEKVKEAAQQHGLDFPIDVPSKGSSQIGGNIATNAGGIHVIRYGTTRDWILGLKVVTAQGTVLELNGNLVKNQTGYDLRGLMIGSEGTLGIIVEATLQLTKASVSPRRVLCSLESREKTLSLLRDARDTFEDILAFEYFERNALEKVMRVHTMKDPLPEPSPFYAVIELDESTSEETVEEFFAERIDKKAIINAVISQSTKQASDIMRYRELISETLASLSTIYKNDIATGVSHIPSFLAELDALLKTSYPDFETVIFGHIGDGNLHLNILKPAGVDQAEFFMRCREADKKVFSLVQKYRGSISAEHGVGLLKKDYLLYSRSKEEIDIMRGIKRVLDPNGILNPGKIFD